MRGLRGQRLRMIVPLVLLVMILMRLVWMQLRSYPLTPGTRAVMAVEVIRGASAGCSRAAGPLTAVPPLESRPADARRALTAAYEWLAPPALVALASSACAADTLDERGAIKMNQFLLAATVLMATLMTRFITSSWTVALVVAAMLLSRGQLLADIGAIGPAFPAMFGVTTWLACCAHYLRTGARASLALAALAVAVGSLCDAALGVLSLAMPALLVVGVAQRKRLAAPVIKRLRGTHKRLEVLYAGRAAWPVEEDSAFARFGRTLRWAVGMEFPPPGAEDPRLRPSYGRGSLLRTLDVPFMLWAYWQKRWLKLSGAWLVIAFGVASLLVLWHWALSGTAGVGAALHDISGGGGLAWAWTAALAHRLADLHLATSLVIVVFCAVQSPAAGLASFLECVWLLLTAALLLGGGALLLDSADQALVRSLLRDGTYDALLVGLTPRPVALWLEPAVLSLGVAGIYNLMKVLDTRIAEKS